MNIVKWKKALAVILAAVSCGTLMLTQPAGWNCSESKVQAAATLAELEARKQENQRKIQEYENKLAQFSESQKQQKDYQDTLQEKINAVQSNMQILDTELEDIKKEMYYLNIDITNLEEEISAQEVRIEEGLEEFKLRIRAMYMNSNDSLISALAGATDFYDLLSKYELISRVAKHDDEFVTNLKEELEAYEANKTELEAQKLALQQAQADKESTQQEMQDAMSQLRFAYADSQAEQERLAAEKQSANKSISQLEEDNRLADEAEAEIREQIRLAEEARKKAAQTTAPVKSVKTSATTVKETSKTEAVATAPETAPIIAFPPETAAETTQTTKATAKVTVKTTTTTTTTTTVKPETTVQTTVVTVPETAPEVPETLPPTEAPTEPETQPDYDESAFGWPCPGYYYISSGFGTRWGTTHKGIDISQNAGADAVASRAGKVIKINTSCTHNYGKNSNCCGNGYGNYVLIDHEDGTYSTMYAHLQSVIVSVGDYVEKGQTVGYVGTTGWSTGYHLHFEIRKDGTAVNPSNYLNY